MSKIAVSTILAAGLFVGSASGVVAQEDQAGHTPAPDAEGLFCVRASDPVEAGRLPEAIVAGTVTITVVPDAACAPEAELAALSDAEHFGAFMGHVLDTIPTLTALRNEPRTVPEPGPASTWLAELASDPDAMAAYVAFADRLVAIMDDELAWLEAHPPRPCWAAVHEGWQAWFEQSAVATRSLATALRAQDVDLLIEANADIQALEASGYPDVYSLGQTCWPLSG